MATVASKTAAGSAEGLLACTFYKHNGTVIALANATIQRNTYSGGDCSKFGARRTLWPKCRKPLLLLCAVWADVLLLTSLLLVALDWRGFLHRR